MIKNNATLSAVKAEKMIGTIELLHVEDSDSAAMLLAANIQQYKLIHINITRTISIAETEQILKERTFDAVILDLTLPDSYGLSTIGKVRKVAMNTPVVVLSSENNDDLAVEAIKSGAQDFLYKGAAQGLTVIRSVRYAIERTKAERKLKSLAKKDSLTQLPNRSAYSSQIAMGIGRAARYHTNIGLLLMDLDKFKHINDTLGHQVGDQFLIEVSRMIQETLRNSDFFARVGGDEFVIVVESITKIDELRGVAEKVLNCLRNNVISIENHQLQPSASIGITLFQGGVDNPSPELLMRKADLAMYHSKEQGGNSYHHYSESINLNRSKLIEQFQASPCGSGIPLS